MATEIVIRPKKFFNRLILGMLAIMIVFLFWLALSSISITALIPAGFAIILSGVAAALIKKPFLLVLNDDGLIIRTPWNESFIAWEDFQQFTIRHADPWTTYIDFKLKDETKESWLSRMTGGSFRSSLFPYFELSNERLLQLLRKYQYKNRTHLII
jgi:hypothetical protein